MPMKESPAARRTRQGPAQLRRGGDQTHAAMLATSPDGSLGIAKTIIGPGRRRGLRPLMAIVTASTLHTATGAGACCCWRGLRRVESCIVCARWQRVLGGIDARTRWRTQ